MSLLRALAPEQRDQFIEQAAHEQALLTLALRIGSEWKTYKARLLELRQQPPSLVVEYPAGHAGQKAPDLSEGQLMGVGFRRGQRKCLFTAMLIAKDRIAVAGNTQVGVVILRWPEEIQELQRRAYERVDVPAAWGIDVDFWPVGTRLSPRHTPPPELFSGCLVNLSAGGIAVLVPPSSVDKSEVDTAYACRFAPVKHHPPFTVQALLRHQSPCDSSGQVSLGFQFLGLEFNPRTLSRLARVVMQFRGYSLTTNRRRPR